DVVRNTTYGTTTTRLPTNSVKKLRPIPTANATSNMETERMSHGMVIAAVSKPVIGTALNLAIRASHSEVMVPTIPAVIATAAASAKLRSTPVSKAESLINISYHCKVKLNGRVP